MSRATELMNALQGLYSLKTVADDGGVIVPTSDWQALRTEVERLEARAARLEQAVSGHIHDEMEDMPECAGYAHPLEAVFNESPSQSLAAIEARTLERAAIDIGNDPDDALDVQTWLERQAARLRAEAEK